MTLHMNRPQSVTTRGVNWCPTCERRRRFVVTMFVWYEPLQKCCGCGDSWSGPELCSRPAVRQWRVRAIAEAKKAWATALPSAQGIVAIRALVSESLKTG